MAERRVFWSIVTNFSRARRDSDRLRRSLEDLERTREDLDDNAVGGNRQVARSERDRQRAEDNRVRSTLANAARQRQANDQTTRSQDRSTAANDRAAASSQRAGRVNQNVAKALNARQRATLALEAAERRLAATEQRHGRDSQQYANSLLSVQRRQLDLAAANDRVRAAQDRNTRSTRNADSAITKLVKSGLLLKGTLAGLKFAAIAGGISALVGAVSSLSAGILSLLGPLGSMANALAALPQLASVAAGAIGTIMGAFSGVGEALKAGAALRKDAKQTARDERALAEAVVQAQRQMRNAREAAADAARTAYRSVRDASRSLVEAQKAEYEASKRLSEARQQAVRDLQDMKKNLRDLELSERGASLSVEEARQRLNETMMDPGANDVAKQQAQLAYDEAIARLDDVKKEQEQAKKDYSKAQKKGVDGSDAVIEAQQAQIDSTLAVRDAIESLGDAQREAARSQRDAAEAIGDAERAMRDANEAFATGPASVDKYNQALKELSPEGKKFVAFLLSMQDGLKALKFAAQDAFFPGLTAGIKALKPLLPVVTRGVTLFGTILGSIAEKLGGTLGSNVGIFNRLLDSNAKILVMAGDGMNNLLIAVLNLMDAARPFTEWLSSTVLGWTEYWKQISIAGNETGSTAKKLETTKRVLQVFGGILKGLWGTFKGIGRAGMDLGMDLLTSFRDMTKGWSEWTNSVEGQNSLKEWFDAARPALHEMGLLIGDIVKMFFELGKTDTSAEVFKAIRTDLLPPIQDLLEAFQQSDIIPQFVSLMGDVVEVFTNIIENSPALDIVVGILSKFTDVMKAITSNKVGATVIGLIAAGLAGIAAIKFVGAITGLNKVAAAVGNVAKKLARFVFKIPKPPAGTDESLIRGIWNKESTKQLRRKIVQGIGEALLAADRKLTQWAGENRSGIVSKIQRAFQKIGLAAMQGMTRGLRSGQDDVNRAASDIANDVADRTERDLEIHSPSKVYERIGRNMDLGMAAGIRKNSSVAEAAAGDLVDDVVGTSTKRGKKAAKKNRSGPASREDKRKRRRQRAGKAGSAASGVADAASLLPGKVGAAANSLTTFGFIIASLAPLLTGLGPMLLKAGGLFLKLAGFVKKAMLIMRAAILANPWILLVVAIAAVVFLIIKYWDQIKDVVMSAINWILKFIKKHWMTILTIILGPLGLLIGLIVKHWDKIGGALGKAIDKTISALKTAWNAIKGVFEGPFTWVKDKVSGWFSTIKTGITNAADGVVKGLKKVWDGIKSIFSSPIEWVVNTVIDDWLIGNINKVLGAIGLDSLKLDKVGPIGSEASGAGGVARYARGGTVGGQGNRDSVPALLMPGEFVMRKDAVKQIGVSRLRAMNEGTSFRGQKARPSRGSSRNGRFGFGDFVGGVAKGAWDHTGGAAIKGVTGLARDAWGKVKGVGGMVVDLAKMGAAKGLSKLLGPLRDKITSFTADLGLPGSIVGGFGNKMFDWAIGWIKGADDDIPLTSGDGEVSTGGVTMGRRESAAGVGYSRGGLAKFARGGLVQKFHSGGPVLGMKPGAKGTWVKLLEYMTNQPTNGTWDKYTDSRLKAGTPINNPGWKSKPSYRQGNSFIKWMNATNPKRVSRTESYTVGSGDRVGDVLKQFFGARYADHLKSFLDANGFRKTVTNTTTNTGAAKTAKALNFAKSQAGKPYVWGGVGPRGYDCSGFQSAVTNNIKGKYPYHRLFATGNMATVLPRLGFKRGVGSDYTIGWRTGNPGHTSGRLGTTNIESTGGGIGVRVGGRARSPLSFPNIMHLDLGGGTTTTKSTVATKSLSSLLKAGSTVKVPGVPGYVGGRTWSQARQHFGLSDAQLLGWTANLGPRIRKLALGKRQTFMRRYGSERNEFNNALDLFNDRLGLRATGAHYTSDTKKALVHALAHTYGRQHDPLAFRPWSSFTSGESALLAARNQTERDAKWQKAMTQIATWGFTDLLNDLFSKGSSDDGAYNTALDVSTKYDLAKALNEELAKRGDLTEEDLQNIIKFLGYVNSQSNPVGIRDIARYLGLSDYDTVRLFERGSKTGKFSGVPSAKLSRLNQEVTNYRNGTFYANTGGEVPGVGNTDSVPAMLTPGEFVIKKQAAKALGLNNLWALNNAQHFADGGLVRSMAPKVADIPTIATTGVSSRRLGNGTVVNYNVTYDVDIYNPVAEEGTRSMLKALQRQSALKKPASETIKEAS